MWSSDSHSYELSTGDMYICQKIIAVPNLQISSAKHITTLFIIEYNTHLLYMERWYPLEWCFLCEGVQKYKDEMTRAGRLFVKRKKPRIINLLTLRWLSYNLWSLLDNHGNKLCTTCFNFGGEMRRCLRDRGS